MRNPVASAFAVLGIIATSAVALAVNVPADAEVVTSPPQTSRPTPFGTVPAAVPVTQEPTESAEPEDVNEDESIDYASVDEDSNSGSYEDHSSETDDHASPEPTVPATPGHDD